MVLYGDIRSCTACPLRAKCQGAVPGDGPANAKIMFVGEAPGKNEDLGGKPFIGQAGQLLNWLLERADINRDQLYITNTVKCRPSNNRTPTWEEAKFCGNRWLHDEVSTIRPDIIVGLGATASKYLLDDPNFSVETEHGIPRTLADGTVFLPVYHPAAGLHNTNLLRHIQSDFDILGKLARGVDNESLKPQDQYPERDYKIADDLEDIDSFWMAATIADSPVIALDTETVDGKLWSVQISYAPGTGMFIPADLWNKHVEMYKHDGQPPIPPQFKIIAHNWLYDAQFVDLPNFTDTMVQAYLLGYPQGLKDLAYRYCGMEMDDYQSMVRPYREAKAKAYLEGAVGHTWAKAEPYEIMEWSNTEGKLIFRDKKPQAIGTKIKRILSDMEKKPETDPYERWYNIEPIEREQVEAQLGVMPDGTIEDAPYEQSVFYSTQDADATIRVYNYLMPLIKEAKLEFVLDMLDLPTLPVVKSMMENGIAVDADHLKSISEQCLMGMMAKAEDVRRIGGKAINPNSDIQVADLVYGKLGFKPTKKTSTGRDSTVEKELKKVNHPVVKPILEYRHFLKIKSTYADTIAGFAYERAGLGGMRVNSTIKTTRTETGRLAMGDPVNLQNIPVRTALGKSVRKAFIVPEGRILVSADYAQIEMRVLAHVARCLQLLELFQDPTGDIHTTTASKIFGVSMEDARNTKYRYPAKTLGFGIVYGISAKGLYDQLVEEGLTGWDERRCQQFIDEWYQLYPEVRSWQYATLSYARINGYVKDMFGRIRHIPEIHCPIKSVRAAGERQATNMPIQAGAQGILKLATNQLFAEKDRFPDLLFLLQIHDEIMEECDDDGGSVNDILRWNRQVMEAAVQLSVPLKVDTEVGYKWGDMKEVDFYVRAA